MVKSFLKQSRKTKVFSSLLLTTFILLVGAIFVFAIDTNFTNHFPGKSATIKISNPNISVDIKGTTALDSSSVTMKLNGESVIPKFKYKGRWIESGETRVWVIDDYSVGTVSYNSSNLKDGQYTVEISIKDNAGNILNESWSFTVAEPPSISLVNPVNNSEQLRVSQISAVINDNTSVNWDSVKLKINNTYIDQSKLTINKDNGTLSYDNIFADGSYTASLETKDLSGNFNIYPWSFVVDSNPPELTSLQYFQDGMNILDGNLKFSAQLKDLTDINVNVALFLDGNPLQRSLKYKGYKNYYGDYIITSRKEAVVSYGGIVPNGSHTLALYSEDKLGNQITRQWNFTVSAKPLISNETPNTYGEKNMRPVISAIVKSPNGMISGESIVLMIDGEKVNHTYDETSGMVSYTPSEDLENEKFHTVTLTVKDNTDLAVTKEWKFYTNTYPEMSDSNIENCLTCHQTYQTTTKNFEDVHRNKLKFNGTHSDNDCEKCHNYITVPADCQQCHNASDPISGPLAQHGSSPSIKYQVKNNDTSKPLRVIENREMWDCIICHQPGSGIGGGSVPSHDIPELHKSTGDASCTTCHAKSLTREHARDGRTDQNNNAITCNTCHKSSNPKVVKAIADKNTACSSCHTNLDHESLHTSQLEDNCSGCHNKVLSTEHVKRGQTCDTCHKSTDQKVITAITNKDKTCSACHENPGHEGNHDACTKCHSEGSSYNK
ncbi:hypothetical protein [Neobacillus sp. PS3-40]|uniref:hypothetical protein n=1 Tax=Neobacillus sp. PS3-40 TaxID=3070679 RepID=UPI0027E07769|nr:hypothetical protein [Neobacillus sp. PS3-40]WML46060.1 hypothetical protein RCG20_09310 [Neobacillus sp. PS3-40]